jgi:hypothetical protein
VSFTHWSFGVWQKYPVTAQESPVPGEGEQYPWSPQSESVRQLLPTRHWLGAKLAPDARQMQGASAGQSESMVQVS